MIFNYFKMTPEFEKLDIVQTNNVYSLNDKKMKRQATELEKISEMLNLTKDLLLEYRKSSCSSTVRKQSTTFENGQNI